MTTLRLALLAGLTLPLAACATTGDAPAAPVAAAPVADPAAARTAAHDALWQLFRDSDEAQLRRNPLFALFRGDMRFADQLGDNITDAYFAAEREANESDLARLAQIDSRSAAK